ncbi:MAG TPA: Maf family protein [Vicinamibacteria bacterium]
MRPLVVLASASPRRAHILESLGVAYRVSVSAVSEDLRPGEAPAAAAERLARAKAAAVASREDLPVLGADTIVVCDEAILGKPATDADAAAMLRRLSGRTHEVVTGVCLMSRGETRSGVEQTAVTFAALSDADIAWYVATGEPRDKAGAYHVDGRGALFITRIDGSPSNVAGLPIGLLRRLAREAKVDLGFPDRGDLD